MCYAERALRGGPGGRDPRGPPGSVDSDRWARGVPLPPARGGQGQMGPGMRGGAVPGLPALHKTDNAFKPGQKLTDDPEEEEKQRKFKVGLSAKGTLVRWQGEEKGKGCYCCCMQRRAGWRMRPNREALIWYECSATAYSHLLAFQHAVFLGSSTRPTCCCACTFLPCPAVHPEQADS